MKCNQCKSNIEVEERKRLYVGAREHSRHEMPSYEHAVAFE